MCMQPSFWNWVQVSLFQLWEERRLPGLSAHSLLCPHVASPVGSHLPMVPVAIVHRPGRSRTHLACLPAQGASSEDSSLAFLEACLLNWAFSVQRAAMTCGTGLWYQYEPSIVQLGTHNALGQLFIYKSTQRSPRPLHSTLSQNANWLLPVSQTGLLS